MGYVLQPGVTFCLTGDRAIALDVRRDRYFGFGPNLTRALVGEGDLERLVAGGFVQAVDGPSGGLVPCFAAPVARDVRQESAQAKVRPRDLPGVVRSVIHARALTRPGLLAKAVREVERRKSDLRQNSHQQEKAEAAAVRFNAARPFAPFAPTCLLDSVAMAMFILGRGAPVDLVLGVASPPFAAHAWVQARDCVLNDEADRVAVFTPILVV